MKARGTEVQPHSEKLSLDGGMNGKIPAAVALPPVKEPPVPFE
jgi:hypothetical protein